MFWTSCPCFSSLPLPTVIGDLHRHSQTTHRWSTLKSSMSTLTSWTSSAIRPTLSWFSHPWAFFQVFPSSNLSSGKPQHPCVSLLSLMRQLESCVQSTALVWSSSIAHLWVYIPVPLTTHWPFSEPPFSLHSKSTVCITSYCLLWPFPSVSFS